MIPSWLEHAVRRLGIRSKLILLFVAIKVVPLVLLAVLAWDGVSSLGGNIAERVDQLSVDARSTADDIGKTFSSEAQKALDERAREELERMTTDTARAIADFLYDRDRDVLLAASLEPGEAAYRSFLANRKRGVVNPGKWKLAADGKRWEPVPVATGEVIPVSPGNPENRQDFHYRPPETVLRNDLRPLYHELTVVGLDGHETLKISNSDLLPTTLHDVSKRENTYSKAESYFAELKKLKPGEIYVSDVIGPYVGSHVIGPYTPEKARLLNIPFAPEKEAYAGQENPVGRPFRGIVRWATPIVRAGKTVAYLTLALDHGHLMSFTDNLVPTDERYSRISDAANGNYAFIWDYLDRCIAHPRHHSIVGFDPATGEYATPWLEASLYERWKNSGLPLRRFLADVPAFDRQSLDKMPAQATTLSGMVGLDCRYLNFAPQCHGWHDLTQHGGSGSFLIFWTGVWKRTTAATIPYFTGRYGRTPRGFGYVTVGANIDYFQKPAKETARKMNERVLEFADKIRLQQREMHDIIGHSMQNTAFSLATSTLLMVIVVVGIAIWLASMLTRHVTALIEGLRKLELGELGFRFDRHSDDELGKLAESLNRMAASVQESFLRLEFARHEAELASHLKSDFLARMSHELRTPLNGILGFAEIISTDAPTAEVREQAEIILQSGQHLLTLLNDVLDLAKIEAGSMTLQPADFALPQLLRDAAAIHAGAALVKGLQFETEFADDLPAVFHGDAFRLQQVINNLLNNAIKFTEEGRVAFRVWRDEKRLYLAVCDTGPGIPLAAQSQIFEKFSQGADFVSRKHGGTGLGLALVREIIHMMGGDVSVESKEGEGACLQVWLPLPEASGEGLTCELRR